MKDAQPKALKNKRRPVAEARAETRAEKKIEPGKGKGKMKQTKCGEKGPTNVTTIMQVARNTRRPTSLVASTVSPCC